MAIDLGDPLPIEAIEVHDAAGQLANAGAMTLTVTLPDGSTATPGFTNPSPGRYSPGVYIPVQSGPIFARWHGTGLNEAADEQAFYVRSLLSALPWVPALRAVAALVPNRTLDQTQSDPLVGGVFTANTVPTEDQAAELLDQAVAEVAGTLGAVDPSLYDMARSCATMRAAGRVELAYPTGDGTAAGREWLSQAERCLDRLGKANAAVAGTGTAGAAALLPQWSFPDPVSWGDRLLS